MTELNVISPSTSQNNLSLDKKSAVSASLEARQNSSTSFDNTVITNFSRATGLVKDEAETTTQKNEQINSDENSLIANEKLETMMGDLNAKLESFQNYLRFEKDEDTEKMVVFIKNSETGEVIRQIPSSEFLEISKNITQFFEVQQQLSEKIAMPTGLLADTKA